MRGQREYPGAGLRVSSLLTALLLVGAFGGAGRAGEAAGEDPPPEHAGPQTTIGMEGVYFARYRGPLLEAAPFDEAAPIVLRIADVTEDTATGDSPSQIYELRYIGTVEGVHDLRDFLVRRDGQPIVGLEPLAVEVVALLPPDHQGQLAAHDSGPLPGAWPYRLTLQLLALAWLAPVTWWAINRLKRRRVRPAVAAPEPTLAEQLRPLVEAALAGEMTASQKARLEMLLIGFWRERLQLAGLSMPAALARMREDSQAGELLRQLEGWLHQPPGRAEVDLAALLAPYQHAAPPSLETVAAPPQPAETAP